LNAPTPSTHKVAFIVATKDRPDDLRRMLQSVQNQSVAPDQVIVVDSSASPVEGVTREFPGLCLDYLRHQPPSAAAQRNAGLARVHGDIDLIGFMDDDIVLERQAIAVTLRCFEHASPELGGAGLNPVNVTAQPMGRLKRSRVVSWLGIYSPHPGRVAPSGWQSLVGTVTHETPVGWLPTTAVVWRRAVFDDLEFDPFFDGYSYLEDLDFSYAASRHHELVIVPDARYCHYPSSNGRINGYRFGRVEVRNRLYFVRKHGLSVPRCYLALLVRWGMTLLGAVGRLRRFDAARGAGNLVELVRSVFVRPVMPARSGQPPAGCPSGKVHQ